MTKSFAELAIGLDTARFQVGMQKLAEAARRAGDIMRKLGGVWAFMVDTDRRKHGPRNVTGDGLWQSDLCGSWLHGSCPLPDRCDCTCHGGTLR